MREEVKRVRKGEGRDGGIGGEGGGTELGGRRRRRRVPRRRKTRTVK